jgi:hypothetical protein
VTAISATFRKRRSTRIVLLVVAIAGMTVASVLFRAQPSLASGYQDCPSGAWCIWEDSHYGSTIHIYSWAHYELNQWDVIYDGAYANDVYSSGYIGMYASSIYNNRIHIAKFATTDPYAAFDPRYAWDCMLPNERRVDLSQPDSQHSNNYPHGSHPGDNENDNMQLFYLDSTKTTCP